MVLTFVLEDRIIDYNGSAEAASVRWNLLLRWSNLLQCLKITSILEEPYKISEPSEFESNVLFRLGIALPATPLSEIFLSVYLVSLNSEPEVHQINVISEPEVHQ